MGKFRIEDDAIYFGDNGRMLCGKCSGMTARATGRDISGQRIHKATSHDAREARETYDFEVACESCGKAFAEPSRIIVVQS